MIYLKLYEKWSVDKEREQDVEKYVYHVSDPKNRDSILANGLEIRNGYNYASHMRSYDIQPAIFATNSDNENYFFDRSYQGGEGDYDDDVWEIDTTKIPNIWYEDSNYDEVRTHGDEENFPHIVTYENIPKEALSLYWKGKGFVEWEE